MNEDAKGLVLLVACHMGVPYDDLMTGCKRPPVVRARDIAALMVRRKFGMKYFDLAALFNMNMANVRLATYRAVRSKSAQRAIDEIKVKL